MKGLVINGLAVFFYQMDPGFEVVQVRVDELIEYKMKKVMPNEKSSPPPMAMWRIPRYPSQEEPALFVVELYVTVVDFHHGSGK